MNDSCHTPEFWIDLVETSIDLDWAEAFVPKDGFPIETALALAERLSMEVDIDPTEYVFYQIDSAKMRNRPNQVLH